VREVIVDEYEVLLKGIDRKVKHSREQAVAHMRSLGERLIRTAKNMEEHPEDRYNYNSLGEIQGQGHVIDRLLGILGEMQDLQKEANSIREAARRQRRKQAGVDEQGS
jgi:hypothetical protein